ncbi:MULTISPECIES: heme ABC transporter permease [Asticcacaulis]|jgi:heme exporter protein C|uniref:Heme exporter protein C n=1 Tax=Asticcacaulis currens TaxID=2984210 RepID=A0ABT5IAT6_9CAUL|nr:heme ABC transporter permease [Asticcacaulis currens]MDC7693233.1 heme ABC transporter permease [Asticcacaulis currens]
MIISWLANPERFSKVFAPVRPWVAGLSLVLFVWGLYLCFVSPEDYQQGDTVRIMYIHVPAAWMALFTYLVMGVASFFGLIFRHALADAAAKAAAPIGAVFTALALITGSLWGKPMWGTWWEWDGRMTSVLVLFLFYIGYIALHASIEDEQRAARSTAILALIGLINLPIIKFSVDWWNTLHQGASVFRPGGPTVAPAMLWPLLMMALAYKALFVWLWLIRIDTEILSRKYNGLRARLGFREGGA